uniref:DUF19 domain-containing protein n=1 Tax=Panagrellus redivivus TaxID=6233 RepID=A0A7E4VLZ6_PANRE
MKYLVAFLIFAVAITASAHFGYPYLLGMTDDARLAIIESAIAKNSKSAPSEGASAAAVPSAACNYAQFTNYLAQFALEAGFDQSVNYTNNGDELVYEVNALFKSLETSSDPTTAFDKFCVAQRQFFNLLDVDQIEGCINAPALVSWGYSDNQAVKTVQFFSQVNYQCTAGFRTYIGNFGGYLNAYAANINVLNKCEDTFNATLSTSPRDPCPAVDTYTTCVGSVYKNVSVDQAWTACEVVRKTNLVVFHECRGVFLCQLAAFTS